jgi:hypothetical protein
VGIIGRIALSLAAATAGLVALGPAALADAAAPAPPRPWWLTLLSLLAKAAIVAGAAALVGAARGGWVVHPKKTQTKATTKTTTKSGGRQPSRTAGIAGVVLGLGALGHAMLPKWPPHPPEILNEQAFSSGRMPAVDLELPPGWRLTHGTADGVPNVLTISATGDAGPGTTLVVQTSPLDEPVDVPRLASELAAGLASSGAKMTPTTQLQVAGLPGALVTATRADGAAVSVRIVKRADRLVSYLYCFGAPGAGDPCAPVLARLRWREPER